MATAMIMHEAGGPQVLRPETVTVGEPGPGQVRLKQTAIGVNFHDIYVRSGLYQTLTLPGIPGLEAAGVVEAVGEGVTAFAAGDRVAYTSGNYGAYADQRLIDAGRLVRLPDDIDDVLVAGMMVRGLTARILLTDVFPVREGSVILVQAAAGGVGQLLCQWARHLGATVIGTVGSQDKAERARRHGCHHVILYREQNVVDTVKQLTDGRGVDVAYDSVGKDTFYDSLACLAPRGHLVNFGQSSGPVEPLAMPRLAAGSFTVVRPMLGHYTADPADRDAAADAFFQALRDGILTPDDPVRYALQDVGQAHDDMEARRTHGAVVLMP
ncbi:MAG: quinone oxidoreductase [Alcanivorax sp.]|jgi:NADPH:quinone reductase|nr:quinone oxidoreductase [Alloalcanivorax venustensis]MAQ35257.1 quinone oxidoreductase [Alcanivorax sp.]SMO55401.1 NADPH2:quinone reductase [Alcanivorax sp. DSM 26295]MCH2553171.1 quinone oxidoreductase [Alcanivorax sp.]HAD45072.1 quinone oxidoreductase [Alcanivorax sp.]HAI34172.1 quinone oxidoreductase [Alcanivorax sp.]|tara:strand:- start:564 stop:1538 length:975 start_codon:yes stop_codon:yes gene_type:complete